MRSRTEETQSLTGLFDCQEQASFPRDEALAMDGLLPSAYCDMGGVGLDVDVLSALKHPIPSQVIPSCVAMPAFSV